MTYPAGAGPTAGRFAAEAWTAPAAATADAATSERPFVQSAHAKLVGGRLRASFDGPTPGHVWWISRITVQADNPCNAYTYVGQVIADNIASGTSSGQFDENDPNQRYLVPEGSQFSVEWDTTTGDAIARIEYIEV